MDDIEKIVKRESKLSSREIDDLITISGIHSRLLTLENSKYGTRIMALSKESDNYFRLIRNDNVVLIRKIDLATKINIVCTISLIIALITFGS